MKVLLSTSSFGEFSPEPVELLKARSIELGFNPFGRTLKPQEILSSAAGCDGIVAGLEPYSREVLQQLQGLRVISRVGIGLDSIDLAAAKEMGICVRSTPDAPTGAVSELTIAMMLNLIRGIQSSDQRLKRGEWKRQSGFLLGEMTVGIVGLGRIGRRVAEAARFFGATVMGSDVAPNSGWLRDHGVELVEVPTLLSKCDVVSLHIPYDRSVHHFIDAGALKKMKPHSYLINTSRGGLVDEAALAEALAAGHIAGAAIDTFETEPYSGALTRFENVILTPHVGSFTRASRVKMEVEAVQNLLEELAK